MRKILAGAIAAVCLSPVAPRAEVVRFDIVERLPAFAGRSFGDVGPYERITARATIALNPSDDRNAVITDLAQARNERSVLERGDEFSPPRVGADGIGDDGIEPARHVRPIEPHDRIVRLAGSTSEQAHAAPHATGLAGRASRRQPA